jgi:hypothetical protein
MIIRRISTIENEGLIETNNYFPNQKIIQSEEDNLYLIKDQDLTIIKLKKR